jgi:Flp pilus assembly protein TadD
MFLNNQIAPGDPRRETVHRNFEKNLETILRAGVGSGAKILLNTVAVNLKDCPPFASLPAGGRSAEDKYSRGQALLAQNKFTEAREALQQASDDDALPFRTDARENEIIRAAAKNFAGAGVTLLDAAASLAAGTPGNLCGDETFYEHVHFNFDGAHRLGLAWAQELEKMLPQNLQRKSGWLPAAECEARLGLSEFNRALVLSHMAGRLQVPPFSSQANNAERTEKLLSRSKELQGRLAAISDAAKNNFAAQLRNSPDDFELHGNFALLLEASGDAVGAIAEWRRVRELMPQDYFACYQLGRLLLQKNEYIEAEARLREALRLRSGMTDAWVELGNALSAQKRSEEAQAAFDVAQRQRPDSPSVLLQSAKAQSAQGNHAKAESLLREAIRADAAGWEPHFLLGGELDAEGKFDEARVEFAEVARLRPDFSRAHFNLGIALAQLGRLDEAEQEFAETLRLEPDYKNAQDGLAKIQTLKLQRRK